MAQCSILYLASTREDTPIRALRALGFHVDAYDDLPTSEAFARYHAIVVRAEMDWRLPMLAARLRATPHFGRRVLLALVPEAMPARAQREAIQSGFDFTLPDTCGVRRLAATVLRLLRPYPEYRCVLRSPAGRRKAA